MTAEESIIRRERREELQTVIFSLADRLTIGEAYKIGERLQKRIHGQRLFKNYGSFRASQCYHRKQQKLKRLQAKKRSGSVSQIA